MELDPSILGSKALSVKYWPVLKRPYTYGVFFWSFRKETQVPLVI